MTRSEYIKQALDKLRRGEPRDLITIRYNGQDVASLGLFCEGGQLKLCEIVEISS